MYHTNFELLTVPSLHRHIKCIIIVRHSFCTVGIVWDATFSPGVDKREKNGKKKKQHNNMLQCKCISVPAFGPTQCATKVRAHVRFMTFCQWYLGGFGCFLSLFTSQPLLASIYALAGRVHLFHMPVFSPTSTSLQHHNSSLREIISFCRSSPRVCGGRTVRWARVCEVPGTDIAYAGEWRLFRARVQQ